MARVASELMIRDLAVRSTRERLVLGPLEGLARRRPVLEGPQILEHSGLAALAGEPGWSKLEEWMWSVAGSAKLAGAHWQVLGPLLEWAWEPQEPQEALKLWLEAEVSPELQPSEPDAAEG